MADDTGAPTRPYVVIGGGVAGVSCAEELATRLPDASVLLLSASRSLKGVANLIKVTQNIEEFEVVDRPLSFLETPFPNVSARQAMVDHIDAGRHVVVLQSTEPGVPPEEIAFHRCCVCTGARPQLAVPSLGHSRIAVVRDTQTVQDLGAMLSRSRSVMVVGNGAIAMELVQAGAGNCGVVWAVKDDYIGRTFFDSSASAFLLAGGGRGGDDAVDPAVEPSSAGEGAAAGGGAAAAATAARRAPPRLSTATAPEQGRIFANALGPKWVDLLRESASGGEVCGVGARRIATRHGVCVESIRCNQPASCPEGHPLASGEFVPASDLVDMAQSRGEWGAEGPAPSPAATGEPGDPFVFTVMLSDGSSHDVDGLINATGVWPATEVCRDDVASGVEFARQPGDGGLVVDRRMRTTGHSDVYAAGDAAFIDWPESRLWHQMRLWSQARVSGAYAGACMAGVTDEIELEGLFNFELFAHSTAVLGQKVVLLGAFNGQRLGADVEEAIRSQLVVSYQRRGGGGESAGSAPEVAVRGGSAAASTTPAAARVQVQYRITPGSEYIKLVLLDDRVVGCLLIGETDLEEAMENVIMNQLPVRGLDLLDPNVDVDHIMD